MPLTSPIPLGGSALLYEEDGFSFQSNKRAPPPYRWARRRLTRAERHELVTLQQRVRNDGVAYIHAGLLVARRCLYGTGLLDVYEPRTAFSILDLVAARVTARDEALVLGRR